MERNYCPRSFRPSVTAKMSRGLTKRIFKHALSEAWIKCGDVVVDPFGGIGSTGIIGASMGLRVVCVELEEKFVVLGKQNFELNRKAFEVSHFGHSYQPQIIQGDSRDLYGLLRIVSILEENAAKYAGADCVVGSPPFQECHAQGVGIESNARQVTAERVKGRIGYGYTEGQLGAMKPGNVEAIISSPPYAGSEIASETNMSKQARVKARKEGKWEGYNRNNPQNLGNLKPGEVDAVVSSPPFEDSMVESGDPNYAHKFHGNQKDYGNTAGNIGNDKGETFWQAARQIVSECHKILKPCGHAIWVVKAFVRKGKIVDFPGDWRRLCEAQGFTTVHEHHAMLVKETRTNGLFEEIVETKERKSFFRRLAEKKGSPKIDYEVVLCMRKISSKTTSPPQSPLV